jgi:sigma-B regulation protein RsbU (phosphoserine phosphatase)
MKISLRQKLALLIALSICAAVVPYSLYSAGNFSAVSLEREKADFQRLGALVRDNLNSFYYNYLTGQMADIIRHKEQLRKISILLSRGWSNMEVLEGALRSQLIGRQAGDLRELGLVMAVVNEEGRPLPPFDRGDLGSDWDKIIDIAGRPLTSSLDLAKLPAEGRFSVYRLAAADGSEDTYLGLLMPDAAGENVVVNMVNVNSLREQTLTSTSGIVEDLRRRLETVQLGPEVGVGLVGADRRVLVHRGASPVPTIPDRFYDEARQSLELEQMTDLPDSPSRALVRIEYFKPLDWYVVMAVPERSITEPARTMGLKMALAGGLVALMSLIVGLTAGDRLIKPLLLLSRKAGEAAELDLNSPEAETFFTRGLPTERQDEIGRLASAFSQMGLALAANVRQLVAGTAAAARLDAELTAARDIQLGMLPNPAPPGGLIRAYLSPAKEVGGDLYDYFAAPGGSRVVVIGDISGKGVPAALFMAMTSTLIRQAVATGLGPAEALTQVNSRLSERNPSSMFVTLFIGFLDPLSGDFRYANAGHCFPIVLSAGGPSRFLDGKSGPMVGVFSGIEYTVFSDIIKSNELCFLYTDGVTEAQDDVGCFFGSDCLVAALECFADGSPAEAVESVVGKVRDFQGKAPQADDITILAFVRN